jgi:hypothetical protein
VCLCSDRPRNTLREPEVQVREISVLISGLRLFRGRCRESLLTSRELMDCSEGCDGRFSLACQQNTSMDLLIPEPMTLIEWWSKGMKHSQILPQSHDGETSRNAQFLSGMHRLGWCIPPGGDAQLDLLIVALNQLSRDCSQVTEQSSGTAIRYGREIRFGSGSGGWNRLHVQVISS